MDGELSGSRRTRIGRRRLTAEMDGWEVGLGRHLRSHITSIFRSLVFHPVELPRTIANPKNV